MHSDRSKTKIPKLTPTRIYVLGPDIRKSGGIGALYSYAKEHFSQEVIVDFVDSRGRSKLPIVSIIRLPIVLFKIWKILKDGAPNLFHINFSSGLSFIRKIIIGIFIMNRSKIPITFQLHGSLFQLDLQRLPRVLQKKVIKTLNESAGIFVFGDFWKETLVAIGVRTEKIMVITMGVPDLSNNQFAYKKKKNLESSEEIDTKRYILFCGDVTTAKGIDILIQGISEIQNQSFRLIVLGEGDLSYWRNFAKELKVDTVFCGRVSSDVVHSIIPNVDYFVLPSMNENMPVSLIEAASAGVPIITSNVGAIDQYFDNHCVFLLASNTHSAVTQAIDFLENSRQVREDMSRKSKMIWQNHFSVDKTTKEIESLWKYIASEQ